MEARALIIEDKLRTFPPAVVKRSDFHARDAGAVDPRSVLREPNISLYCLDPDNRKALFVEVPPECSLSSAPFLYMAQYESAVGLIEMPYETVHALAQEVVIDPSRLILVYSVGRCGSTLVSQAFNATKEVDSLSEPDVFTQMRAIWGPGNWNDAGNVELLKSCMLIQCAPGRLKGATTWAVKFRSMVTEMADPFYEVFPEAKIVFLYRNAEPWARSFLRIMHVPDPLERTPQTFTRTHFGRVSERLDSLESVSALERLACMWASVMEKGLEMQQRGLPMFIARYEELSAAPGDILAQMFAYCGLDINAVRDLETVLQRDSQEGSALSRASTGEAPVPVTREHLDELRRLITHHFPGLTADTMIPGTRFPANHAAAPV